MSDPQVELRSYYEEEARLRLRPPPSARRVELRSEFLDLLRRERRRRVLDLGAGPGGDGVAFTDSGHVFVGIDLAHANGVLAAAAGIAVVQGSIGAPPFKPKSFDAGWSMSTLMHVPEHEVSDTATAMTIPLRPGAPLLVGVWGGESSTVVDRSNIAGHRRRYNLRPIEHNRDLLATCGSIEQTSTWDVGPDGWDYQVFLIRVAGDAGWRRAQADTQG